MLNLSDDLFINHGGMRRCYRHPDDPSLCVKVYRPLSEIPKTDRAKRWRIWLGLKFLRFNINQQEYLFWKSLVNHPKCGIQLAPYFPDMHGMVDTNMGPGLVEELLMNHDGTPVQSVWCLRKTLPEPDVQKLVLQLQGLADIVSHHALSLYDWNLQNFLLVQHADGHYTLRIADLEGEFGNKELIKLSRWSSWVRRRKLNRRISRFFGQFDAMIAQNT